MFNLLIFWTELEKNTRSSTFIPELRVHWLKSNYSLQMSISMLAKQVQLVQVQWN